MSSSDTPDSSLQKKSSVLDETALNDFDLMAPPEAPATPKESAQKPELIEGEIVDGPITQPELLHEKKSSWEAFKEQMNQVLREANVSKRQLYLFFGGLFLVILVLLGVVYGYGYFLKKSSSTTVSNSTGSPAVKNQPTPAPKVVSGTGDEGIRLGRDLGKSTSEVSTPSSTGKSDSSLQIGLDMGQESRPSEQAALTLTSQEIRSGILLGGDVLHEEAIGEIEEAVIQLQRLNEALAINVLADLEKITNEDERPLYVARTLFKMKAVLDQSKLIYDDLTLEISLLQSTAESLGNQKKVLEKDFFDQLNVLSPDATDQTLQTFLNLTQEQAEATSHYKALQAVAEKFVKPYNSLKKRITAIELNQDALIKGVKVVEVKDSGLDLTVPAEDK